MKRGLKRIVPLILILAILGCAVWYLLVYDREFTRDVLLHQARYFESRGNQKTAAWLYDLAYYHSSNDDSIAIELADQYLSGGNYTKAETTLSDAISENPSADLYIKLCSVYVAQDKLLDAVTMLDNIPYPSIKEAIDAARPGVPTPDSQPGFYNQYLTVNLTTTAGTLYLTTDGRYPTTEDAPSDGAVPLTVGETTIYAMAIGEDSLVSPLGIYGYTVGGIVEAVRFADPAVEEVLRLQLGKTNGEVIYTTDLWTVTVLDMPFEAKTYQDLTRLTNLTELFLPDAIQSELHYVSALQKLSNLIITGSRPTSEDLTMIAGLPALESLTLYECGLSTVAPLEQAKNLKYLDLRQNSIRNLAPLAQMTQLQQLYLSNNAVVELSQLSGLTALKTLDVSYNNLTSLDPIGSISGLEVLTASYNQLTSVTVLGNLRQLRELELSQNALTDVLALANCTRLEKLDISNNSISDITGLSNLVNISRLDFAYNLVTALPVFATDCPLVTVDGSYNQIADLTALAGLPYLNNVLMDYNPEIADLLPLDSCPLLIQVNVYGTQVTEVSFLTDKSVIVNYNPTDVEATAPTA